MWTFGKIRKNKVNKSTENIDKSISISPERVLYFDGTKYSLYKIKEDFPFYFISSNDNLILCAFVLFQYKEDGNQSKIVIYSKGNGFLEVKFFYSINSSNDINSQATYYMDNYKDLIRLFEEYKFKNTIEDQYIPSIALSQAPYDTIDGLRGISVTSFKGSNNESTTAPKEIIPPITDKDQQGSNVTKSTVEEIESSNIADVIKKTENIVKSPELQADPHYQIGYLMQPNENSSTKTSFVINEYTKRPMKVFISNRPKDLSNLNQHVLVAGVTGSGKTTFINNLTNILLYHGVNIISLDIKLGTLDTPINIASSGHTKKELVEFINDRKYKNEENIAFSGFDVFGESLTTIKDMKTNKMGKSIVPLMLYYRANDKNELENMRYFTRINILDLPEIKSLRSLKKDLDNWKKAESAGKEITNEKYKTLDDIQKDYNNKLLLYKNEVTTLLSLYIETLAEIQTTIAQTGDTARNIKKIIDNGSESLVKYVEDAGFMFLPSNNEFKEIVFNVNYLFGDKEIDTNAPAYMLLKRLIEAHEASRVIDLSNGIRLYDILQDINSNGNNFYLIIRTTPAFAMFYLLYTYYSTISLLANDVLKSVDPTDKDSPLVMFVIDEGTQLFAVNSDIGEKYVKVLKEGQQQTRGIRLSWLYGVQQPFKGSFDIQTSLGGRVIFRAQPADANAVKALLSSISNSELFDAVMKQDFAYVSNMNIFIDEYNNVIRESVIKELPNRAIEGKPDGPINIHNYIEKCEQFLIDKYSAKEYEIKLFDFNLFDYVNKQFVLLKPIDSDTKALISNIIRLYNSTPLLDIKNDKNISDVSLMGLAKTLKLFEAINPVLKPMIEKVLDLTDSYNFENNKIIITKATEIFNEINSKLSGM